MTDWDKLLSPAEVAVAMRERRKEYIEQTIWKVALPEEEKEGWEYQKDTSNPKKVKVRKKKPDDEIFENELWTLFAQMGFNRLNRDRSFTINYSKNNSKQIDVFAMDDETALVIECKCAENGNNTKKQWKTELEAIRGYRDEVSAEIRNKFGKINVKFIFATKNYVVGEQDKKRMKEFNIAHFDEKVIKYYEELAKHLGSCAKYQLLGSLFANKKIEKMDNRIPAIRGRMGGYTYYAFSIQPEILLKIGYVLHRSEANDGMMPTYQRIIKKARLQSVHKFIENKGFFPNSIVVSIDSGRPLQFDLADKQGSDPVTKLGILHLPNQYRSVYIIDGQHRLYGYSDSKYAHTNSIPVVAFENMEKEKQVKLFMEINENQKAVSKNLRNTLNADLLWVSENPEERRKAIRAKLAQELGDDESSPLHNRVIIGEDQADEVRCITLDTICQAIEHTDFLTKFNKDLTPARYGLFDLDDSKKTLSLLKKYIVECFVYLQDLLPEEWEKSPKTDGILLFNNAIGGIIRLLGDIALQLKNEGKDPKQIEDFVEETHYYLDPLQDYFKSLTPDEKKELRSAYGGNGPKHYWRTLQREVHKARSNFNPDGLEQYWDDHSKNYNEASIKICSDAEKKIKKYVEETLTNNYPDPDWQQEIPKKNFKAASVRRLEHMYNNKEDKPIWDFFSLEDLRAIVIYGDHWSRFFEKKFTLPSEQKKAGDKKAKTGWLLVMDGLQKNVARANFCVKKTDYEMLVEVEKDVLPLLQ